MFNSSFSILAIWPCDSYLNSFCPSLLILKSHAYSYLNDGIVRNIKELICLKGLYSIWHIESFVSHYVSVMIIAVVIVFVMVPVALY